MANALQVHVYPKKTSMVRTALAHVIYWTPLVAVISFSEIYLGGSWVINVLVLLVAALWFIAAMSITTGKYVGLSKDQAIRWVGDGAPDDVKAWKDAQ